MFEYRYSSDLKKRKIKLDNRSEVQPQEIFFDKLSRQRMNKDGIRERKMEVPLTQSSFRFLTVCLIFIAVIILTRSFQLQIVDGEDYSKMAQRNRFAYMSIDNARGIVYDSKMEQLVFNQPRFSLVFDKNEFGSNDWDEASRIISEITGVDSVEILDTISESNSDEVTILKTFLEKRLLFWR